MHSAIPHEISNVCSPCEILSAYDEFGIVIIRGLQLDLPAFKSLSREVCDRFYPIASRYLLRQSAGDGLTT
ncbi:hypothetical protein BOW52_10510 [Solemya elarraichensis gill symbiont]|uniref:Uncharacterized protein n=1 Tax=Solemya elarraichensis gill symbiont TaxID=1918949 RepID=A0A1T2KVP3_9GAMM|nr:hypothetical protein BOW52_10510 [Solemya elarraichensis gill symbiont]